MKTLSVLALMLTVLVTTRGYSMTCQEAVDAAGLRPLSVRELLNRALLAQPEYEKRLIPEVQKRAAKDKRLSRVPKNNEVLILETKPASNNDRIGYTVKVMFSSMEEYDTAYFDVETDERSGKITAWKNVDDRVRRANGWGYVIPEVYGEALKAAKAYAVKYGLTAVAENIEPTTLSARVVGNDVEYILRLMFRSSEEMEQMIVKVKLGRNLMKIHEVSEIAPKIEKLSGGDALAKPLQDEDIIDFLDSNVENDDGVDLTPARATGKINRENLAAANEKSLREYLAHPTLGSATNDDIAKQAAQLKMQTEILPFDGKLPSRAEYMKIIAGEGFDYDLSNQENFSDVRHALKKFMRALKASSHTGAVVVTRTQYFDAYNEEHHHFYGISFVNFKTRKMLLVRVRGVNSIEP